MANPHSPEELAALSTLIHNIVGWIFLILSGVLTRELLRGRPAGRRQYIWPGLGMFVGFGLTTYIFFHQIFHHQVSAFAVPLQNQHQLMGLVLGFGALLETLHRAKRIRSAWAEAAWPMAITAVGVLFLVHEQGTMEALLIHWAFAGTLVLAGLVQIAAVISGESAKAMRLLFVFLLAAASIQLIVYRESPGAHAGHGTEAKHDASSH